MLFRVSYRGQHYNQQHYIQHIKKQHYNENNEGASENNDGAFENNDGASENNKTSVVGPSFCGKTHLLLNKLRLNRLDDPLRQIRIITRSPEQYKCLQLEDVSVEENVGIWKCIGGVV